MDVIGLTGNLHTKKILALAIPATIENVLQTSVGFIDTLLVAKIGLLAVTAVGVANTILAVYLAVFIALSVGTSSLIARYLGKSATNEATEIAVRSTALAIITGLIFSLMTFLFGKYLLSAMGANQEVMKLSTQFFYIVGGSSVFIALMTIFGSILRAAGDTKSPMEVSVVVNLVNIVLDFILIFGLGPFPALGVVGTAIGTVLSRALGTGLLFRKIQKSALAFPIKAIFKKSSYKDLINLSLPAAIERLIMRLGQVVYFGLIVSIGVKTYAAHSIAGNIESFTYMPGYGLAIAAATLVGNSIGAENKKAAKEYGFLSAKIGILFMSLLGIFLFFGAPLFARWFTTDAAAIGKIVTALRIDAFIQPFLAVSLILTGALQGMGDTKSPLYSTAIGMWGIRIIGVYLLSIQLHMDIAGIWIAIGIDLLIRAIFLTYKFDRNIKKS